MASTFLDEKISSFIEDKFPEFVQKDHPVFVEFLKEYYKFLEASKITLTNVQSTDQILLENKLTIKHHLRSGNNTIYLGTTLGVYSYNDTSNTWEVFDNNLPNVAVRDLEGNMKLMNGNQTMSVMTDFLLKKWENEGRINGNQFIGSTIVTTELVDEITKTYGVETKVGLTGFKWIAKMVVDFPELEGPLINIIIFNYIFLGVICTVVTVTGIIASL